MANKKVSQLTSKPSVLVTDLFPIADPSTGQLYKTTISDLGTAIGSGVSSVNGLVGSVVLDTDDIQELVSPTNKWFTDTRARAAISAGTGISYNSGTGVITNAVTSGQIATALGYTPADDSLVVKLAGTQTITGTKTFSSAVTSTNFVLSGGTGNTGLYFGHTDKVVLANYVTGGGLDFETNGGNITMQLSSAGNLSAVGTITGSSIIKSGGTSSQFLKADGSVDSSTYALDSAVVHNTGNETVAGQKTFSSTLYGASAVFSSAVNVQSINVTGITASPSVYITTNGSNHAVSIVQSGAGYAIYASGNVAVIGTGYFSSSLTAASLSSTAGYNFTLPSASGTLALTSNLSSYLPLAGGTLTGALSGTSATFSGLLTLNSAVNNNYIAFNHAGTQTWYARISNANNSSFVIRNDYLGGTNVLTLAESGAATFSSSVTTIGTISIQRASSGASTILQFKNEVGADRAKILFGGSNEELAFYSGGGSSEHMRITSSGNVGIGTTAPATPLDVNGVIRSSKNEIGFQTLGLGSKLEVYSASYENIAAFRSIPGDGINPYLLINTSSSGITLEENGSSYGALMFKTGASERMRITSGGLIFMNNLGGYSASYADVRYDTTSKELYYQTSSQRYKDNIVSLEDSLSKIDQLRPVRYRDKQTQKYNCGLIAEEVIEIIPEVVFKKQVDGFDELQIEGINYSDFTPFLIKAIKELKAKIETLENK